jgi:deoxyribodipyrimidine photolyase
MWVIFEGILPYLLVFIGLIIVYFIIREFRLMYSRTRLAQLELEREKINLLKADLEQRGRPFYRVSPQDLEELKRLDEENVELETDIFARHTAVEKRLKRLESRVALTKLDRMIEKIKREEERLG